MSGPAGNSVAIPIQRDSDTVTVKCVCCDAFDTSTYVYIRLLEASSRVSRCCCTCATAAIGELSHWQLEPLMMSQPTTSNCKLTFLTILLPAASGRVLSLDRFYAKCVQIGAAAFI